MIKRRILIGDYDTAVHGKWTLHEWTLDPAVYKTNLVDIPGHDGGIDLSLALCDGKPRYESRMLTATLESSEGTRIEREMRIGEMINRLDGFSANIVLPDDPCHYLTGRVHVETLYNDSAHASVRVSAVCDPWRYAKNPVELHISISEEEEEITLMNGGLRAVNPKLTVTNGTSTLFFDAYSWTLSTGEYLLPDLILEHGASHIRLRGPCQIVIFYREAIL